MLHAGVAMEGPCFGVDGDILSRGSMNIAARSPTIQSYRWRAHAQEAATHFIQTHAVFSRTDLLYNLPNVLAVPRPEIQSFDISLVLLQQTEHVFV